MSSTRYQSQICSATVSYILCQNRFLNMVMFQLLVFLSYFYLFDKSLHKQMASLLDEVNKLNVRYKRLESLILTESGVMALNFLLKTFLVIEGKHFFYFILTLSASFFLVDYILLDAVFSYLVFFLNYSLFVFDVCTLQCLSRNSY